MELTGKIIKILPLQSGKSAKGEWQKQDFIIETQSQYPKKICISAWNSKFDLNSHLETFVKVSIDIESREYNERWYTDVKAWKIEPMEQTKNASDIASEQPIENDLPWDNKQNSEEDILPF